MTRIFQATWILPIILACASFCLANFEVVYEWKYIDFVWETDSQKAEAIETGSYDYTKIITHDIQPLPDGRILVTTPRYYNNPASISTISNETCDGGPLLAPYPDWSWHTKTDCTGITSVSRVFLDDYNRLWFVDSGKIGNEQVCSAKILVFNLDTDELIIEFEIPSDLSHSPDDPSRGRLELHDVEIVLEGSVEKFWAYIADVEGYALLIWDGSDIWRLNGEKFAPALDRDSITVVNETFATDIGITVLKIFPPGFFAETILLFRPLQGPINYAAATKDIHNSKSGAEIPWYESDLQMPWVEPAKIISPKSGALFSGFPESTNFGCWNIQTPLSMDDGDVGFLDTNITTLQWVSSAKINEDVATGIEYLWITSNRYQKYVLGTMDFDDVNFRILTAVVGDLIANTTCDVVKAETLLKLEDIGFSLVETE